MEAIVRFQAVSCAGGSSHCKNRHEVLAIDETQSRKCNLVQSRCGQEAGILSRSCSKLRMQLGLQLGASAAFPLKTSQNPLFALGLGVNRPATPTPLPRLGVRCEGKREDPSMAARLVPQPTGGPPFASPIQSYDVHIYFWQTDEANTAVAKSLRQECIEKFPDLNIYKFWDRPIGPHPIGMFEVDLKTVDQFCRFVPWIQVNRRGLSVLVHPNTGRELDDHTINAIWIGDKIPLNTSHLSNLDDNGSASDGIASPAAAPAPAE